MFAELFEIEASLVRIAARLSIATILGGLIGFERELRSRPAGLRTNMMVALAAATFTMITNELVSEGYEGADHIRIDPLRVIEAVVAGVAFLGAGAIIRCGDQVHGLTTGASLWMSGALGVAAGGGFFKLAAVGVLIAVTILHLVAQLERCVLDTKGRPDEVAKPEP